MFRHLRRSFSLQLAVWFGLLLTLISATLLFVGGLLLHRQLLVTLENLHDVEGKELSELLRGRTEMSQAEVAQRIASEADSDIALFYIQIHAENGALLYRTANLGDTLLPVKLGAVPHRKTAVPGLGAFWTSQYHVGPWQIQIASRLQPVYRVLHDYARVCGILAVGVAALGLAVGWGFSRLVLRPIRAIEQTARRITIDHLDRRVPVPPGQDELAALVRLLNEMLDRLQTSFGQIRRFSAEVSHELKTPLTIIRLQTEKLRNQIEDPVAREQCDDLLEEVGRLHRLVEQMLFLSRAESGGFDVERQPISAAEWVESFAEDAQALAEDQNVMFVLEKNDRGVLHGDPALLQQLLLNVVSNAVRFSPEGGRVTLLSEFHPEHWLWQVRDEGPGVPDADLERIFERFVRLGPSSSSSLRMPNLGLGLAICRSIAALHGGSIHAGPGPAGVGLEIIVRLPHQQLRSPQ